MKRTLINMMLRDANPSGNDGTILFHFTMDDIDAPTLRRYRTRFNYHNAEHPWSELSDIEFLTNIGGYAVDRHTSKEGLTIAGLMMFGKGLPIREKFDNLRMDYIDYSGIIGDQRYSDRLTYDGRWENNLFNFMSTVVPKLTFVIPRPFQMEGIFRNDDTIQHKAVREAFTNMIIHSDFLMNGLIRVKKYDHSFELTNPGLLKLPIEQIYRGGESKARNQRIQNMLRMIGYGENIGSGFPLILKAWADKGWERPVIIEQPDLDQTTLVLTFTKSENILHNRTEKALKYVLKELTDRQRIIIDHISRNALITTDKLSVQTGVDARTIRRDIKDLRDKGILQREGGRKNGHWVINIP